MSSGGLLSAERGAVWRLRRGGTPAGGRVGARAARRGRAVPGAEETSAVGRGGLHGDVLQHAGAHGERGEPLPAAVGGAGAAPARVAPGGAAPFGAHTEGGHGRTAGAWQGRPGHLGQVGLLRSWQPCHLLLTKEGSVHCYDAADTAQSSPAWSGRRSTDRKQGLGPTLMPRHRTVGRRSPIGG